MAVSASVRLELAFAYEEHGTGVFFGEVTKRMEHARTQLVLVRGITFGNLCSKDQFE